MVRSILLFIIIFLSVIAISEAFAKEKLIIEIRGVQENVLQNVQARLAILEEAYGDELTSFDIQNFYREAPNNIKKALEPYGYFKAQIHPKLEQKKSEWTAYFKIEPGTALRIHDIDLKITGPGKDDPVILQFIKQFPLVKEQVLWTDEYETAKETLFQVVNNQGYLKAVLEKKEIRIDLTHYTATIILHLNTGPRYYFGHISFANSPFAPEFLQRFVSFREGEPFSSMELLKFQQDLSNGRYFKNVIVNPEFDQAENYKIPTRIEVTVPKSQQYNIGLGYGTFTGPRLTLGMDLRRIADEGQRFTTQLKLSSVLSGLAAKYYIPGNNPLTDQYTLGLNVQRFVPKNGNSLSETLSAGYLKTLGKGHHSVTLNLLNDRYSENDLPLRNSHLLYPSYNISRISADDIINPHFGSSINFTIQGASENIASTTNFFQAEIKNKYIFSPSTDSRVIFSGNLGYTVVNDLNQLPLTMNFFAGGLNSIRGYAYDSIGPGRYLRVGSVEFQHKIVGNWSGAAFYDFGNASDHFNDPLKRGDGFGLIYTSMIGPIKIYVARAESNKDKPLSIEFSIGPEF